MDFWDLSILLEAKAIVKMAIAMVLILFARYGLHGVIKRIQRAKLSLPATGMAKLDHIAYLPLSVILWTLGVSIFIGILAHFSHLAFLEQHLAELRKAVLACSVSWLLLRWKGVVQQHYREKKGHRIDESMIHILGRMMTIVIVLITAMFVLQNFGLDILPLVAFGGIGAAAVGFAGKDVIANFFGGAMLCITRPFHVGDAIFLPKHGIEGTVEEIGWYLTSVRDKDKRPVYLPNAIFSNELVINIERMSRRKIDETISVRYEDFEKLTGLTQRIREELKMYTAVDATYPLLIHLYAISDHSLDIHVEVFTFATKWEHFLPVKEEVLKRVYKVIVEMGAETPSPTTIIQIKKQKA